MDQGIIDQLDRLQRGARDLNASYEPRHASSTEYSAYDGYDQQRQIQDTYGDCNLHTADESADQPMQLDSFDERLLRQPDQDSRYWQAAQGYARLSLPPARSQHISPADFDNDGFHAPEAPTFPCLSLSQFTFSPAQHGGESTSPGRPPHLSSPAFTASQRQPAPYCDGEVELRPPPQGHRPALSQTRNMLTTLYQSQDVDSSGQEVESETFPPPFQAPQRSLQLQPGVVARTSQRGTLTGTPVVQGIQLVATRELPDRFRSIFSFPLFNAVQSKCFPVIFKTNDNFVLSSPTGSGKTAILELAVCRLIHGFSSGSFKIVYMAPTKSLCSERLRDWQAKFATLDLQCAELTGDTDNAQLRNVQYASIIITTPEKWDSMTRKWKDHQKLMQMVKLFLIDEVHILKEDRGPTLEAVVSRMKSIGSDVRFIALSATVPNSQDIATWLGKDTRHPDIPSPREKFGEEFRPVRLQKHVCGYQSGSNDFAFEKILDSKLTDAIVKWSQRKPIMVFCLTRKSCVVTAQLLAKWWASKGPRDRYWSAPRGRLVVADKVLRETAASGVAFHHAGLTIEERNAVEKGYLAGEINVICCTSTLAVGVNLPCHMVIIKGTVTYQNANAGAKEYSNLEIMQMMGRAGRPQFDDSAVAVIMTRLARVQQYEKMIAGTETLESCLHQHLIDHLNAEIGLGTVTNATSAKKWLTGTFLYVRLKDNPEHYRLDGQSQGNTLEERLESICKNGISRLVESDLVRGTVKLVCTEFGDSMARYYIQFDTMKVFLSLPPKAKISEILSCISQAAEFKDIRFRAGEKPLYKELNKNPSMKFPIPVNIDLTAHKVSLILQSVLGAIEPPAEDQKHRHEYNTNKAMIFQHVHRLIRCIIDCQLYLEDSISARNALMLARSFGAQVWDDSPLHMKQLEGIGLVAVRKFVAAGLKSIEDLANTEPGRIEQVLSRNPPFGSVTQQKAMAFPQLRISMRTIGEPVIKKGESVTIKVKAELGFLNAKVPETFQRKPVYVCLLADTSDGRKAHFARISAKKLGQGQEVPFSANLNSQDQTIRIYLMCDEIAGTQQVATLKPEVPGFMFPAPKPGGESKPLPNLVNAPNTSKRRAATGTQARIDNGGDEFSDTSFDEVATTAGFANIEDFDDEGNEKNPQKKTTSKRKPSSVEKPEAVQMPNGKWTCNHACKDKTACKHGACCREGLDKKPKPPKAKEAKKELSSDPRQTQLDMKKTKEQTMVQPPPARKQVNCKEANDLNQVHNNIMTSTKSVPLLNGAAKTQATITRKKSSVKDEFDDDDFGLDTLGSDDFPVYSSLFNTKTTARNGPSQFTSDHKDIEDDMLDMPDDTYDDKQTAQNYDCGLVSLLPSAGRHDANMGQNWDFGDATNDYIGDDGGFSPLNSLEHELKQSTPAVSDQHKSIFITGTSTDSVDDNLAFISGALQDGTAPTYEALAKRPLEDTAPDDASQFFSASKRTKLQFNVPSDPERLHATEPMTLEGTEFLAQVAGLNTTVRPSHTNAGAATTQTKEEDLQAWFERELGTEFFTFAG